LSVSRAFASPARALGTGKIGRVFQTGEPTVKKRAFRPTLGDAGLEERVVLSAIAWVSAVKGLPNPAALSHVLPTTSVQVVSNVGSAINLAYRNAARNQVSLSAAATATGSTVTPAQYRQQTVSNLANLSGGLLAASRKLPFGNDLFAALTAPTTTLGQMVLALEALPTAKPNFTVADVNSILGGTGFPNFSASGNQANTILRDFVLAGVNGGRFRVIGFTGLIGVGPLLVVGHPG
jgi:hypothetical protein